MPPEPRIDLSERSDDELWQFLSRRLRPGHDWSPFLWGEQVFRIRTALTQQLNDVSSELSVRTAEMAQFEQECHRQGPAGKQKWFEAVGEHAEWRKSAIRFKRLIENRLPEVKRTEERARAERNAVNQATRKEDLRKTVRALALAIATHQDAFAGLDAEPTAADLQLWRTLDELTVALGTGKATLAQMLLEERWG